MNEIYDEEEYCIFWDEQCIATHFPTQGELILWEPSSRTDNWGIVVNELLNDLVGDVVMEKWNASESGKLPKWVLNYDGAGYFQDFKDETYICGGNL